MLNGRHGETVEGLFAYGTLQIPEVMRALIRRVPNSVSAELRGYVRHRVVGQDFPGIAPSPGVSVHGLLYCGLTSSEFEVLDAFEDTVYTRRVVSVDAEHQGPLAAHAYIVAASDADLLKTDSTWCLERFVAEFGEQYLHNCVAFRAALRQSNT